MQSLIGRITINERQFTDAAEKLVRQNALLGIDDHHVPPFDELLLEIPVKVRKRVRKLLLVRLYGRDGRHQLRKRHIRTQRGIIPIRFEYRLSESGQGRPIPPEFVQFAIRNPAFHDRANVPESFVRT